MRDREVSELDVVCGRLDDDLLVAIGFRVVLRHCWEAVFDDRDGIAATAEALYNILLAHRLGAERAVMRGDGNLLRDVVRPSATVGRHDDRAVVDGVDAKFWSLECHSYFARRVRSRA